MALLLQLAGVLETSLHLFLCLVERLTFFACGRHCDCPPARDRCRRKRAHVLAELRPLLRGGLAVPLFRKPARGLLLWNPASVDARCLVENARLVENACQARLGRWSREVPPNGPWLHRLPRHLASQPRARRALAFLHSALVAAWHFPTVWAADAVPRSFYILAISYDSLPAVLVFQAVQATADEAAIGSVAVGSSSCALGRRSRCASCPLSQDDAAIEDPAHVHRTASPVVLSERVRHLLLNPARPCFFGCSRLPWLFPS